ncbi:MAG: hypothetical protein Q9163_003113 [Psora crenata]
MDHADFRPAHSLSREPLNYLSVVENATIQTPSHRVHSYSHFDIHFSLHQNRQRIKLTLEPNQDIIANGASVQYLGPDGESIRSEPIDRHTHKIFKGDSWVQEPNGDWTLAGWARIMIKRDGIYPLFEGAIAIMRDHHHIQLRSNYMRTKHELDPEAEDTGDEYMTVFRDSDIDQRPPMPGQTELKRSVSSADRSCRSDELEFNSDPTQTVFKRDVGFWGAAPLSSLFGKRQIDTNGIPTGGNSGGVNLKNSIGNTNGCPSTRKVALIGVATDCTYTGSFNSTESARANVIQQIASASSLYEKTFNISLGLKDLTISDAVCPGTPASATPWNTGCGGNQTITDRLNTFSTWRGQRNDTNAYWTLLTTCRTGAEVGLSWLGQLCVSDVIAASGEVVSGANVVAKTSTEWQVIAHESGHTFGAVHDCDSQTCASPNSVNSQQCCPLSGSTCDAGSRYIMNPSTSEGITDFSPCSIGNVCSALDRNSVKGDCLSDNRGVTTITGNQCGNGIVEEGEDCDCGGAENCGDNQCCNPTTCRFLNNAVCDDSNENCCNGCQFASGGTVCRASTSECDPQEVCSGSNATCPVDLSAPDGQRCGNSSRHLQCASGQCTSRDQQCKTLMGSYTTNNDTHACNSQDCTLSCASPEFGPGVCYSMQQNFLDGTICGGGGRCDNGQCKGSTAAGAIRSWIHDNRNLVIGISCAVGGLILLSILGCIVRRCRRPRRPRRQQPVMPAMHQGGWVGGQPPQAWMSGAQRGRGHSSGRRDFQGYPAGWGGDWQSPAGGYPQPSVRYA